MGHQEVHNAMRVPTPPPAVRSVLPPCLGERQTPVTFSTQACGTGRVHAPNSGEASLSCLQLLLKFQFRKKT